VLPAVRADPSWRDPVEWNWPFHLQIVTLSQSTPVAGKVGITQANAIGKVIWWRASPCTYREKMQRLGLRCRHRTPHASKTLQEAEGMARGFSAVTHPIASICKLDRDGKAIPFDLSIAELLLRQLNQ